MEVFDNETAKRVWERVQGRQETPHQDMALPGLIAEELADGAAYMQLSRRFQGREAAALRKLSEEARSHAACLKGICALTTGEKPQLPALRTTPEPPDMALRRCCGRNMRRLAEYERRASHTEFGPIFASLANQKKVHCQKLLELLGSMDGKR